MLNVTETAKIKNGGHGSWKKEQGHGGGYQTLMTPWALKLMMHVNSAEEEVGK